MLLRPASPEIQTFEIAMSSPDRGRRRPRRLASDEAHSWARNLRLKNVEAKLLLMMLALYIDADGCAFVSIPTLAEDAELSAQTIRRRLAWLEEIGAIARVPQWIDGAGRRNSDGHGKRTSDLIMFMYSIDADLIERRASGDIEPGEAEHSSFSPIQQIGLNRVFDAGTAIQGAPDRGGEAGTNFAADDAAISPSSQQGLTAGTSRDVGCDAAGHGVSPIQQIGLNGIVSPSSQQELDPVSPALALRQPYHCGKGLISEPESESPPLPPSGGRESASPSVVSEPADFDPAWRAWRGHEVMRRDLALAEFVQLTAEQQRHCRAAVPLFNEAQARFRRSTTPNFHLWIRSRGFEQFPSGQLQAASPAAPDQHWVDEGSDGDRAIKFLRQLAKVPLPYVRSRSDGARGYFVKAAIGKDILAMLQFEDQSPLRWPIFARGTPQCAAWQQRFAAWVGQGLPVMAGDDGIRAPCQWPPRKDGSFFDGETGDQSGSGGDANEAAE